MGGFKGPNKCYAAICWIYTPQPRIPVETEGLGVKGPGSFTEIHIPPLAAGPENQYESTVGKDLWPCLYSEASF